MGDSASDDSDEYEERGRGKELAAAQRRELRVPRRQTDSKNGGVGVKGMSGLPNLGNTCYLNAALQVCSPIYTGVLQYY